MCAAQMTRQSEASGIDGMINGIPIRKVYVAPIMPQMVKRITRYIRRFGEVESVHLHTKGRSHFAFIQFTSVEAAKAVLLMSKHRVAKHTFTAKPAHDKHQPDYKKFKPPQQDSPRHILNALNDDCLERVFKQFNLLDLSVAADVCVRFQQHAVDAFKSKYKQTVSIQHGSEAEFKDHPDKIGMMLRNFGSLIHSLRIDCCFLNTNAIDLLNMINKYAPVLKELDLIGFDFHKDIDGVHPLCAKLVKLILKRCIFENGAKKLLAPCVELKSLAMYCVYWKDFCIDQIFPSLEEVTLTDCPSLCYTEFEKFVTSNPTLKKLSICGNGKLEFVNIYQLIGQYLTKLEELEIDQFYYHEDTAEIESISPLSSLKKLTLNCNGLFVTSLVNKLAEKAVPLEYLCLRNGSIDNDAIKSMSKLVKLNEIKLEDIVNLTDDHVIELAKGLPQLQAIHLEGSTAEDITKSGLRSMLVYAKTLSKLTLKCASNIEFIGMTDYHSILKSVQDRPNKIKLEIKITGDGDKLNVPDEVLLANRDWVWIDEEIEDNGDEVDFYDDSYDDVYDFYGNSDYSYDHDYDDYYPHWDKSEYDSEY